jgi:hypothetical protein
MEVGDTRTEKKKNVPGCVGCRHRSSGELELLVPSSSAWFMEGSPVKRVEQRKGRVRVGLLIQPLSGGLARRVRELSIRIYNITDA